MDIMNPLADPTNVGGGPPVPAAGITPTQTGQPDMANQWNQWLTEPGNRAMLGQMGAMLMQPTAPGQTFAGKVGQAIAGGAEAKTRNAELALKRQQAQAALDQRSRELQIQQQNADTSSRSADTSATFNQGYLQSLRQGGTDAAGLRAHLDALAKADSENIYNEKYRGKSIAEIQSDPEWQVNALKSWQLGGSAAAAAPTLSSTIGAPALPPGTTPGKPQVYTPREGEVVTNTQGKWRYTTGPGGPWVKVG